MKGITSISFKHVSTIFVFVMLCGATSTSSQLTFVAPTFPEIELNTNDGLISPEWDRISSFADVKEFGVGGFVKFSHNTTHFFALLASNSTAWIAIEFESDGQDCMVTDDDAWVFYINNQDKTIQAVDAKYSGLGIPPSDSQNDLHAEGIFSEDLTFIEVSRKLNTLDPDGADIVFANGTSIFLTFASADDHYDERTPYYLQIQFTDIDSVQIIKPPEIVDWNSRKHVILFTAMVFVVIFIAIHYIIRVRVRPLTHGSRFIDSSIMRPPKFKERWNTLVDRGKSKNKDKIIGGK